MAPPPRPPGARRHPRLVCAGRRADGDAAALSLLEADPDLKARVTLLHDADDAMLGRLYRSCLFTLYPSAQEGWGLPVSESLAHRKVPVTPAASALLESGGTAARTFAAGDAASLAAAVESLLDPDARREAESRIPPGGGLRPWAEVAADLLGAAAGPAPEPRDPDPLSLACPVSLLRPARTVPDPDGLRALLLREPGTAWGPTTDAGLPAGPGATLRLPVAEAGTLRLHVTLARHEATRVFLFRDGAPTVSACLDPAPQALVALEIAAGAPLLRLAFETRYALVAGVAVLRAQSAEDRVTLLEARFLWPAEPA
ncbi:glycosyltransferase [Roseomonas sp. CCTCC AB2023176]|uniref:glycosyltransferase n=1 Tax=Roseomonas sp. CCTCC AB2023176 TaxID=3342640 RepID=UPI0035DA3689